jgi:farnesol dehydrogenase
MTTKYFITGSTGFIGKELAKKMLSYGSELHLLVRSTAKASTLEHPLVTIFTGDLTDYPSVERAMTGCTHVFHLAALAKASAGKNESFQEINVRGTENVLKAALTLGIKRVVFTSTAGVLRPSEKDEEVSEGSGEPACHFTEYAGTKSLAEQLCREYVRNGLDVVIVLPTRVFGPGELSDSNGVTKIILRYSEGKWRWIPGNGKSTGNYVFIDDVVRGHLLAMEFGKKGESYILGGENLTFNELFSCIRQVTGKSYRMIHLPYWLMWAIAALMTISGKVTGRKPLITPGWVKRYLLHRQLSVAKAQSELGYSVTSFSDGVKKTVDWLRSLN